MDFRHRLKLLTSTNHSKIEQSLLLGKLMGAELTLADYVLLLKSFYSYILPCEEIINNSKWAELLSGREKITLLRADLSVLNQAANQEKCTLLPQLLTKEQVMGYLYVMEGATLGGQVICQTLKKTLGLLPQSGAAYFNGYGALNGAMWKKFCQLLNSVNPEDEKQIIDSACLTFTTLYNWLQSSEKYYASNK